MTEYEKAEAAIDTVLSEIGHYLEIERPFEALDFIELAKQAGTIKRGYRLYCVGSDDTALNLLLLNSSQTALAWLSCQKILNDCIEAQVPVPKKLINWMNEALANKRSIPRREQRKNEMRDFIIKLSFSRACLSSQLAKKTSENREEQSIVGIVARKLGMKPSAVAKVCNL